MEAAPAGRADSFRGEGGSIVACRETETQAPLVGRNAEFAVLTEAIAAAGTGRGGTVLVCGQPGIGKSRLAAEAVGVARGKGFTVIEGRADPLLSGLSYAPVVQAFRGQLRSGPDSGNLAALFPDLRATDTGDPGLQRTRMYESVLAVTRRLADRNPVLLVLDDLHCADRGTIELLHYLGRNADDLPLLVLACFRSGVGNDALDAMAEATRRHPSGRLLDLAPLSDRAVRDLVRHVMGTPPPVALLRAVTSRASGVALFAVALTRHLAARRMSGPLPEVIRDVVREQISHLGDLDRRLLEVVAVAGTHGRSEVLADVSGLDLGALHAALRRLVSRRLVTERRPDAEPHYQVAHPLYAEAVYYELLLAERRTLHAAIGAALHNADRTVAAAPHYAAGGDSVPVDRAIEVFSAAGNRALTVGDLTEAAEYLSAALRRARDTRPDAVPALLVDLARLQQGRGRLDEAAELLRDAVALSERRGQDAEGRRAWRHLQAVLEVERGNLPAAVGLARASGRRPETDPPMRLMIHWIIALRHGDFPELALISQELVALPSTSDTPSARSVAHLGAGSLAALSGDVGTAAAELSSALELAARCGDEAPHLAFAPRMMLNGLSTLSGDLATAIRVADVSSTPPVRQWLPSATCYLQTMLATTRYFAGDLRTALSEMDSSVAEARRVGQDRLVGRTLAGRAFIRAERGALAEAAEDLAGARRHYDPSQIDLVDALDLAATSLALRRGVAAEAPALADTPPFGDTQLNCLRIAFAGYAAVQLSDFTEADRIAGILRAGGGSSPVLHALADRQQGFIDAAQGKQDEAVARLRSAATALRDLGMILLAAQAELELAELLEPSEADVVAAAATAAFTAAGSVPWPHRIAKQGHSIPAPRSGPLTRRETEIAKLVGQGLSNADIATALFLSERTVETHLRNVYRKLGLKSRVRLAQWARDRR
ncbi:helix-turn-helix transcriptional regulator [Amycolatopsis jejuensis]|uniref:helix-turn-helix transcriptional regulator n=1 Tax=Amycolatopsis jejuensis TaxID=330084 RepID=UPI000525AFEE|nr:AAA family ATPase [Amycolatopsis jejuensis]